MGLVNAGFIDWHGVRRRSPSRSWRVRRAHTRRRTSRQRTVGRQCAEVHRRARSAAEARACWSSAQPTWGVDAGAAAAIHEQLFALARSGGGDPGHQPGPRRAAADRRPYRRHRAAVGCRQCGRRANSRQRPSASRWAARRRRRRQGTASMLTLEPRREPSRAVRYLTPILALALTLVAGYVCCSPHRQGSADGFAVHLHRAADDDCGA